MDLTEMSIMHHVGIVLFVLWALSCFGWTTHPFVYFVALIYLFLVHERYVRKLRKKLQYEESKQANRKRVLSDSETVRWLNHAVEKIWPICMEEITSQKILLPIIPWFLEKYKPWTAKEAVVQHLYMGRNAPMFTEVRVLRQCTGDDHLALEMGMRFCTADDMLAVLAVKLRRRLGFGMWTKLHITGMQVEGKVLIGIKFLRRWPFIGRLRVCFAEPPYFQMTVKPIFTHGVDVTVLPGIAGWLDKLLSMAFEQTLVQPNMLVADMEKFVSPSQETWFSVDEKKPIAFAKVEVIEASDMKPSDLNGLADPYVKGQVGPYGFRTKIQRKTLAPKWLEEFEIPIVTWESQNVLTIEVRDKDHFIDDALGKCSVNIAELRDGERHDMWLPLQDIKMGRLHLAITVREEKEDAGCSIEGEEAMNKPEARESFSNDATNRSSISSAAPEASHKATDNFEPINVEGQQETGVWIHHPGSEVSQTWEPRKGKTRKVEYTQSSKSLGDSFGSSVSSGVQCNDSSSTDEAAAGDGKKPGNRVRRGLRKITAALRGTHKEETIRPGNEEAVQSPYANIRAANQKEGGVKFIVEDSLSDSISSPGKGSSSKEKTKCILKQMEKSARSLKHMLSRKESRISRGGGGGPPEFGAELPMNAELDSSDEEDEEGNEPRPQPQQQPGIVGKPINNEEKEKSGEARSIEDMAKSEEQSGHVNGNGEGTERKENKEADSEEAACKVQEETPLKPTTDEAGAEGSNVEGEKVRQT